MYNYFKFQDDLLKSYDQSIHQSRLKTRRARHKAEKEQSHRKYVEKIKSFVEETEREPFHTQDDHFLQWSQHAQHKFRDISQQAKFKGFKAIRHRDSRDMSSIMGERERRQLSQRIQKTSPLVDKKIIPPEMQLRNLRSQGPLIGEHRFRDEKSAEALQPPLRFHSVTDKERFVENHLPQSKFNHVVFRTLDMKKNYIGKIRKRPLSLPPEKSSRPENQQSLVNPQKGSQTAKPASFLIRTKPNLKSMLANQIKYRQQNSQVLSKSPKSHRFALDTPEKLNSFIDVLNQQYFSPLKKFHFKGTKELCLGVTMPIQQGQEAVIQTAKKVLKDSQVDREKHLQNVLNNLNYECFKTLPIL